jgi:hypothetical protein
LPQLFHRGIDSVFEINKGVFRPKRGTQLLARNHFSFCLQEHAKYLEGLFLDG